MINNLHLSFVAMIQARNPSFSKVLGEYCRTETLGGNGSALKSNSTFIKFIDGSLWDQSLDELDKEQEILLMWWFECEGRLEAFKHLPPPEFIKSF